ncbi:hypothetical protein B0H11DRAFT_2244238 [Mycena galericulata]|nr:hypothetical protein B0H11DRAFT_2244238 [Mycena galericulata]
MGRHATVRRRALRFARPTPIHEAKLRFLRHHLGRYVAALRQRHDTAYLTYSIGQYFQMFGFYPLETDPLDREWEEDDAPSPDRLALRALLIERVSRRITHWFLHHQNEA